MNANLLPTTINSWMHHAMQQLTAVQIASARLDAQLLLSDVTGKDKAWILAHPEHPLSTPQIEGLEAALAQRLRHTPMAYIRGSQEFYGRPFTVDRRVLVPRPDSEAIIEELKKLSLPAPVHILDVGTGSGCLGITAAFELPTSQVTLADIDPSALTVAAKNAHNLATSVTILQSDLLEAIPPKTNRFNIIIANLPYVDPSWQRSIETTFEPPHALFAQNNGLALIQKLICQATNRLTAGGFLILEADPRQHPQIITFAQNYQFAHYTTNGFALVLQSS